MITDESLRMKLNKHAPVEMKGVNVDVANECIAGMCGDVNSPSRKPRGKSR